VNFYICEIGYRRIYDPHVKDKEHIVIESALFVFPQNLLQAQKLTMTIISADRINSLSRWTLPKKKCIIHDALFVLVFVLV
jgi:deoxyhypusine synthase